MANPKARAYLEDFQKAGKTVNLDDKFDEATDVDSTGSRWRGLGRSFTRCCLLWWMARDDGPSWSADGRWVAGLVEAECSLRPKDTGEGTHSHYQEVGRRAVKCPKKLQGAAGSM
jgi:hypothetical protein